MSLTWNTTTGTANTEVTGTLSFQENNVRAVYIDWDDGSSNKKEESNYQWLQFTEPVSGATATHTYNATGTFKPIIQTINSEGIASRYYSANATESDVRPFSQDTNIASLPVTDFTSTSVMRTQNKTLKSGIDNSLFDVYGSQELYVSIFPTLTNTEIEYALPIKIDLTLLVDNVLLSGASESVDSSDASGGGGSSIEKVEVVLSGTYVTTPSLNMLVNVLQDGANNRTALLSGATVRKVLEVKYKNPKYVGASGATDYTANEVYNRLKVGFFVAGVPGQLSATGYPICYITPGDPIKKADDIERQLIMDFSQSRAAASNVSMSKYYYDDGKMFFSPAFPWNAGDGGANPTTVNNGGTLSAAATTIPVVSTAQFPASGTMHIGSEMVHYTNITATSFLNCTRGFSTSTASTHADGSNVNVGFFFNSAQQREYWQLKGIGKDRAYQTNKQRSVSYTYLVNPYGKSLSHKAMPFKTGSTYDSPWTTTNALSNTYTSGSIVMDQFLMDDFGRLVPQSHIVRLQAEPSSANSYRSDLDVPCVFRITPAKSWNQNAAGGTASESNARIYPTQILASGGNTTHSTDYSSKNMSNSTGSAISLEDVNVGTQKDMGGNTRATNLNEYLLLLFDEKPDKLFFNMTNYAKGIQSATTTAPPYGINDVSVLMIENSGTNVQSVHWEPVEFEDGTSVVRERRNTTNDTYDSYEYSLSKSGVVSFNPPAGWESIKLENLYGGRISTTTIPETAGDYGFGVITGTVSGTVGSNATAGSLFGDYFTIKGKTSGDITTPLSGTNDEDIGSFKYIALPFSGSQYTMLTYDATFSSNPVATNQLTNNATYGSASKVMRIDSVSGTNGETVWGPMTTGGPFSTDERLYLFNAANAAIDTTSAVKMYTMYNSASGNAFWISKDGEDGYKEADDVLYFHIGDTGSFMRGGAERLGGDLKFTIQRINGYDAIDGFSKVYLPSGGTNNKLPSVDNYYPVTGWDNDFNLGSADAAEAIKSLWKGQEKYAVKISISGTADDTSGGTPINLYPELWNIYDASKGYHNIIDVVDNSAYNLNSLAITSSISIGRTGQYFKAITRKGKVFITKTGIAMEEVGFSSVALGDENSSTAFDDHGPETLYGHLHTLRKIQAEDCRVYWDEPQKDGTYVRLFGVVQNVNEVARPQGPRRVVDFTFTLGVENIALIDASGNLMTDIYPLGGIQNEKAYT
jgi:hypothetical protein